MRNYLNAILLFAVAVMPLSPLYSADAPCPSTVPTLADDWGAIHEKMVADAKARAKDIQLVFAGDSISARWTSGAGRQIWDQRYAPLGAINLSISADNSQALLWRLQHGVLEPLHPKMVILLIGANNLWDSPEAAAYSVWASVAFIRKALPDTRVLVQGIFRRENPPVTAPKAPLVNALLAKLDDGKMVKFLDFSSKFLKPDGTLDRTIFTDGCHPEKAEGFQIWADSIQPVVDEWLKAPPIANVPPPPSPVGVPADPKWGEPVKRNDFLFRHNRYVDNRYVSDTARSKCELFFFGDHTMGCWDRVEPLFKKEYGQFHALNFAIGGSRTENILWQLSNGELDGARPKLVVVQVQDNLYDQTPAEDVAAGMEAIAKSIHQKLPETKVLLLGAFPKGEKPEDPMRVKIAAYNSLLAKLSDGKSVFFLDAGKAFLGANEIIEKGALSIPYIHTFDPKSYELWADTQRATIAELMGSTAAPSTSVPATSPVPATASTPATASAPAATSAPASTPKPLPLQPSDVPAMRYNQQTRMPDRGFLDGHKRFLAVARLGKAKLVFFGDSITANWSTKAKEIWDKSFSQWEPANFGISGDRTQHVLWRIENGELEGLKPKAVVVMIGTNNVGGYSSDAIARGVAKIVEAIRGKTPDAKVLLLAIFPRGEKASTPEVPNKARDTVERVNAIIAKLADNQHVFFLDIGTKFLQPDGSISKEIMPEFVHPSSAGHQIWADAITPKLTELMK